MIQNDTIIAIATAAGSGAIAVIRISGPESISLASESFRTQSGKKIEKQESHTVHLGNVVDGKRILDNALLTIFKNPRSYTGEDVVEISCHGSQFIQQEILNLFLSKGCRMAKPGEFTLRAFLNGKMDLSQAEAVADLIASDNAAAHQMAMQQMRGGFSSELSQLRAELLNFASLIELELDFAEEDVAFANRDDFSELIDRIIKVLKSLIDSFAVGNVLKKGIPVAIIGEPNVGKSTLLNALLNEDRAIVSEVAGTTRDSIEDEISIAGIGFRFIDTAGIRETQDVVESIGIKKTFEKVAQAQLVLFVINSKDVIDKPESILKLKFEVDKIHQNFPDKSLVVVANKIDGLDIIEKNKLKSDLDNIENTESILISAKEKTGLEELKTKLSSFVNTGALKNHDTIITNSRHFDALQKALKEIFEVKKGLNDNKSGDLLAIDIRQALYHFGEITGEISNDELLGNIFVNFCIGK